MRDQLILFFFLYPTAYLAPADACSLDATASRKARYTSKVERVGFPAKTTTNPGSFPLVSPGGTRRLCGTSLGLG